MTRPGIKNPFAIIATLEGSLSGAVAPSVESRAVIRYAGRDTAANVTGIDPGRERGVSKLASQIRQGTLDSLYKSSNAIILGDRLAAKIGARVGNTISLASGTGRTLSCTVVALLHAGVSQVDETQAYTLIKTAQILAGQTGLVNAIRIRVSEIMGARAVAARIEAQTGYKSVSWQEANEDLLSAFEIRNFIMYTVVGAILLVASFGTYNIISTITHEKTRDIAILKSLGFTARMIRSIFLLEAMLIGLAGTIAGWGLGCVLCLLARFHRVQEPIHRRDAPADLLHVCSLRAGLGRGANGLRDCRLSAGAQGRAPASGGNHSRGLVMRDEDAGGPLIELRGVTRRIGDDVVTTLVEDIDLKINGGEFASITGPSGSGKSSLLYLLGLLDVPTSGDVFVQGRPANNLDEATRAQLRLSLLGFVFQFHFLLPEFTALANVMLPMRALERLSEREMRDRATGLLESWASAVI